MPEYSIIVPVYKAENYIAQCVDSVLGSPYSDFELILVDDGSPDGSGKICDKYAENDARVRVIHKENGGVSSARNAGLDAARGKYIIFLDSDDFVDKSYFDVIKDSVKYCTELVSFGMFNYVHKADGGIDIAPSEMNKDILSRGFNAGVWEHFIVDSFFASPCNKVFLASVIKDNGIKFKEGVVCFEDYMFCLEYCMHISSFVCVSTPIYYYRSYEEISHVSKRKWGDRFFISRLVYGVTCEFIARRGGAPELSNLYRYTYQAYITELKAARLENGGGVTAAIKAALREPGFVHAIRVITPRGRLFPILCKLIKLKMYGLAAHMISKRFDL